MALNLIWSAFFLVAFLFGLFQWVFLGNTEVFPAIVGASFDMAKTAFEIALFLTGGMCLWLGLLRIAEEAGLIRIFARLVGPFFRRLFPEVPDGHPAVGNMLMNFSANMLGLDNAATPLGLKAMQDLQDLNPEKDTASPSQIMFLVLNTSGLTIIPVNVMILREELGAADPTDVFIPILLATFCSTLVGLFAVSLVQRINLWQPVILAWLGGLIAVATAILVFFQTLPEDEIQSLAGAWSNFIIFAVIALFIGTGLVRKINAYECFIEGAKEGFHVAVRIIPYLVAILVGIAVFRASGAMDLLMTGLRAMAGAFGGDTQWVDAMPTGLMKPLSGSGARGMMVDTCKTFGVDSLPGRIAGTMQGSTETTFYVLAVYFGSVGVRNTRYALACGLLADAAGILAAIALGYIFFG